MSEELVRMRKCLKINKELVLKLRRNEDGVWKECVVFMPEIMDYMGKLLLLAEDRSVEIEIPVEILVQQMKNFEDAYRQKDIVLLADTMEYELKESMLFYINILEELERTGNV